jgi:subtilisin-like proprotein convertase family protein
LRECSDTKSVAAMNFGWIAGGALAAGLLTIGSLDAAQVQTFSSTGGITIDAEGPATPSPSRIDTFFPSGNIASITVKLTGVTHERPSDLDVMLVGPGGGAIMLMSDAGWDFALSSADLTFADNAPKLPELTQISSGIYSPSNFGLAADPDLPTPKTSSLFDFAKAPSTGTWLLYVTDDSNPSGGSIAGWSLTVTIDEPPVVLIDGKNKISARARKVLISGTAKDDLTEVARVYVRMNNSTAYKLASGTSEWKYRAKLRVGRNRIRIYAVDTKNNISPAAVLRVVREAATDQ